MATQKPSTQPAPQFKAGQIVNIPVNLVRETLFVRRGLNQDRVLQFAELYDAGTPVAPIEIDVNTFDIIAGHHRFHAQTDVLDRKDVEVEFIDAGNKEERLARAFTDNFGGPLPPSRDDIIFTITQFLDMGLKRTRICELLQPLPSTVVKNYIKTAQDAIQKARLRRGVQLVTDGGLTVSAAAEQVGVDVEQLRAQITGERKKKLKSGLPEIKQALTKQYRGVSQRNAKLMKKVIEMFEDGEASKKHVEEIISHMTRLIRQSNRAFDDWRMRFAAAGE